MFAKYLSQAKGALFGVPVFMNSSIRLFSLVLALCSMLPLMGCSFPRIIILKDPLTPEEHLNLGVAYEKQGELDAAIKEYKLGAKKLPRGFLYLGNAYFQKQEFDKAEEYYKKAIKGEPGNADAHNNLAWLYYTKKENLDQAESLALKALELNPAKEIVYRDTLEKIREMKSDLANRGDRK
jgi:tetratricopeptide (TPR) repeat protein